MNVIQTVLTPMVLILQGILILLGALAALRDPDRVSSMYVTSRDRGRGDSAPAQPPADAIFVLCMAPVQGVLAALMLRTACSLLRSGSDAVRPYISFFLGSMALMELAFVIVRFLVNAKRGHVPWWRLAERDRVVSWRGCAMSVTLAAIYALCCLSFLG